MKPKKQLTILIMAGGTGGHIFPALAVAQELRRQGHAIIWLGSQGGMEQKIVTAQNIELAVINMHGVRGSGLGGLLLSPLRLLYALWQSLRICQRFKPRIAIGMGGFVSLPGGLACVLHGIPLFIHEQNAIAGMSNRLLRPFSRACLCAFPGAFTRVKHKTKEIQFNPLAEQKKCQVIGNPLRQDILALAQQPLRVIQPPLRVLIIGGSRGAQWLNEHFPKVFHILQKSAQNQAQLHYQVRHQCGAGKLNATRALLNELDGLNQAAYQLREFIEDMAQAYRWADLVICRAGALTISELAVAGKPSLLIPYPYAVDDHQSANARYLSDSGAALIAREEDSNIESLCRLLRTLTPAVLEKMAQQAKKLGKVDATREMARICLTGVVA